MFDGLLLTPMETSSAVTALSALAHPGRLEVFRLLVRTGPEGMAAGDIARATGSLANTLSANLNLLSNARLVVSRRQGRSIIYTAAYGRMSALLGYLIEDCCCADADICAPLAEITDRAMCCAKSQPQIQETT